MDTSKIIRGVVSSGRYTVTAPIVKEDYGLYLKIEGVELPSTYEVDFSNSENSGTSVTMIGNSDGVLIPHQFIDSGKDVFAFLYHVGDNYGKTVYKFRIPNKVRPDRTDEEPTPEEQSTIDQAISALNTAVEQTAQDKADADASALSASADAERAEEARTDAQNYATQAEEHSRDAESSSISASASARASAQSAQSAERSAQSAQDALEEFTTPTASATTLPEGSNATASYADGHFTFGIPTGATGAKGDKGDKGDTGIGEKGDKGDKGDKGEQGDDYVLTEQDKQDIANLNMPDILKAFPTDTASGAVASFSDGADDIPLKSLIVNIDPVQDLSNGDPSPENICPISGWTGMEIQHTGKNLFDNDTTKIHAVTHGTANEGEYTAHWGYEIYLPAGTYTIKAERDPLFTASRYIYGGVYKKSGNHDLVTTANIWVNKSGYTRTITLAEDEYILYFNAISTASLDDTKTIFSYFDITMWVGTEVGDYASYQGTLIPISWQTEAGTVYGGKLDVLSGKLTVYPYYASYNGETLTGEWISDRDVYAVGTTPTIGAQVVNIGAQGTEIQLDAHAVNSLLGVNNIWADTGDTEVEYRANTKLYIERLTAPDSADLIADANIVSGQYFMVGNSLFKATANIASGSAVIVGTNATRKSLAQALNEINV